MCRAKGCSSIDRDLAGVEKDRRCTQQSHTTCRTCWRKKIHELSHGAAVGACQQQQYESSTARLLPATTIKALLLYSLFKTQQRHSRTVRCSKKVFALRSPDVDICTSRGDHGAAAACVLACPFCWRLFVEGCSCGPNSPSVEVHSMHDPLLHEPARTQSSVVTELPCMTRSSGDWTCDTTRTAVDREWCGPRFAEFSDRSSSSRQHGPSNRPARASAIAAPPQSPLPTWRCLSRIFSSRKVISTFFLRTDLN